MTDEHLRTRVRTMQIITFALIQGVVIFGAVAAYLAFASEPAPAAEAPAVEAEWPITTLLAGVLFLPTIASAFFVPAAIARAGVARLAANPPHSAAEADEQLVALFQTKHIIYCALFEGVAFVGLVGLMVDKTLWALAVPVAALAAIAAVFPTADRVAAWLEQQRQAVKQAQRGVRV